MAHSKQSHRSVESDETRQTRRRQKINQQTKKMRNQMFHHDHNDIFINLNEKFKELREAL